MKHLLRLALIVGFCLLPTLRAQSPEGQGGARTLRFITAVGHYSGLQLETSPGKSMTVSPGRTLSRAIPVPSGNRVTLFREIPPPPGSPPGAPPVREVLAQASIPAGLRRAIVVLTPSEAGRFAVAVIDDDLPAHAEGKARVFNFSAGPAAFAINADVHTVAARGEAIVDFPAAGNLLKVAVQARSNSEWELVHQRERIAHPGTRLYVFVWDYLKEPEENPEPPYPPAIVRVVSERAPVPPADSAR